MSAKLMFCMDFDNHDARDRRLPAQAQTKELLPPISVASLIWVSCQFNSPRSAIHLLSFSGQSFLYASNWDATRKKFLPISFGDACSNCRSIHVPTNVSNRSGGSCCRRFITAAL